MFTRYRLQADCAQLATLWAWRLAMPTGQRTAPAQGGQLVNGLASGQANFRSAQFPHKGWWTPVRDTRLTKAVLAKVLKPVAYAAASAVAGVGIAVGALASTHAWSVSAYPMSYWQARIDWVLRPSVRDADNQLAGFLPPPNASNLDADHAAEPGRIATSCIDLALAREDAHHESLWRYVYGVDLGSITRAVITQRGGASTIPMQLARQLANWPAKYSPWQRKVNEAGAAKTLIDLHHGDHRALAGTYLAVAPFAAAYGDVRGIAAAADILFSKTPADLSRAECALLVVMLPTRPSLIAHDDRAQRAWDQRREQAISLLRQTPTQHTEADIAEAMSWQSLPPLRRAIEDQPEAVRLNLGARTRAFVVPHLTRIAGDLDLPAPPVATIASRSTVEDQ